MPDDLPGHLHRQAIPPVLHREHDRQDLQLRVQPRAHRIDRREKLRQAFEGVVLALHRHEHGVGGHQRIYRQQAERWRAVDEDGVVSLLVTDRLPKAELTGHERHELDLRPGHLHCRWQEVEPCDDGRLDSLLERLVPHEHAIHRMRLLLADP